ncbi:MAG: hypothetical protein II937_17330 [Bacteroidales bacterium]|nr:hypothetical protein [Bacteroidales bacterium]
MKKLFLLLAIILLAAINLKAQIPSANCTSDTIVKQGNSFVMSVKINKCDLACYAQFQQLLPEGFAATEISGESDNANFYFENNKVFYQWYKLPIERSTVTLKYNITVSQGVKPGKYQIPGYFSYQVKNRLGQINTPIVVTVK